MAAARKVPTEGKAPEAPAPLPPIRVAPSHDAPICCPGFGIYQPGEIIPPAAVVAFQGAIAHFLGCGIAEVMTAAAVAVVDAVAAVAGEQDNAGGPAVGQAAGEAADASSDATSAAMGG